MNLFYNEFLYYLYLSSFYSKVNNIDFTTLTREEAVLCLMNMKTSQVNMIIANLRHGLFSFYFMLSFFFSIYYYYSRIRTIIS